MPLGKEETRERSLYQCPCQGVKEAVSGYQGGSPEEVTGSCKRMKSSLGGDKKEHPEKAGMKLWEGGIVWICRVGGG